MSEKKGPLDEAIEVMREAIEEAHWAGCEPEEESCEKALRVLEAAGKIVDSRELILKAMDNIHEDWGSRNIVVNLTKGLIESLPEKP
jgi:hypothetical protein